MAHSKAMGLGSMFVLLVVSVIFLPMFVRYLSKMESHFIISGFQDMQVNNVPQVSMEQNWIPDKNTNYVCRAPNGSEQPCDESTFCDGSTQSCTKKYVAGNVPTDGYYS